MVVGNRWGGGRDRGWKRKDDVHGFVGVDTDG